MTDKKLYVWEWKQGGYNWIRAYSAIHALAKAKEMAKGTVLEVDENTFRLGTNLDLEAYEEKYGFSMLTMKEPPKLH